MKDCRVCRHAKLKLVNIVRYRDVEKLGHPMTAVDARIVGPQTAGPIRCAPENYEFCRNARRKFRRVDSFMSVPRTRAARDCEDFESMEE